METWEISDPKVQYILDNYLDKIKQAFAPAEIWLWGSRIYGQPGDYSDVDMILVSPKFEGIGFYERRRLFREATGIARDPQAEIVDVLCYTPEEFAAKTSSPTIVREAVEKGVSV